MRARWLALLVAGVGLGWAMPGAQASPVRALEAPSVAAVVPVQYYGGGGPDWRRREAWRLEREREWRRHEAWRWRHEHRWERGY